MSTFQRLAALLSALGILVLPARAELVFASIGTGELKGLYYPVGRAICELVNQHLHSSRIYCSAEVTPGSVYNVSAVQSGELEFGIIQSDVAFAAYNGKDAWADKRFGGLRSVFGLHSELVTIIARSGAGIREVADLAGKRINVGEARSGTRATWELIEAAFGWDRAHRAHLTQLRPDETTRALCTGEIDANLQIVGHPSDAVRDQLSACDANLVPITGPIVDKLLNTEPYYHRGSISGDSYGLPGDVPSFGVRAVLMTSASMDPRVVDVLVHAVIAHITEFQRLHPVLECLTAKEMIDGLPAPLHPGAIQAYKELGLLK
jgi:uncharacterized protein